MIQCENKCDDQSIFHRNVIRHPSKSKLYKIVKSMDVVNTVRRFTIILLTDHHVSKLCIGSDEAS